MLFDRGKVGAAKNCVSAEARGPSGQNMVVFEGALAAERKWHGYMWLQRLLSGGHRRKGDRLFHAHLLCNVPGSAAVLGSGKVQVAGAISSGSCLYHQRDVQSQPLIAGVQLGSAQYEKLLATLRYENWVLGAFSVVQEE